ncbi:MAG: 16S rRNA (adenine(1518)-N(6)/adenine(1519)-N(6))-dimethyltransferase, partial [Nitrospirae bacterium]|nr:16S rRNA (adenine(1518)-N(6)/adenine(1519)-N(6))-dimethyltransferase [Nitrospirota bacterium]
MSMTVLLQKEVAQRITASPETSGKDYGVLSITVQLHTKPELKFLVPKGAFSPPPEVDSAVVHFEVSPKPLYTIKDETFFLKVVKAAFSRRRKTILNSLRSLAGIEVNLQPSTFNLSQIKEALFKTGIDSKSRAEVLSIKDFIKLADALIFFSHTKPEDDK